MQGIAAGAELDTTAENYSTRATEGSFLISGPDCTILVEIPHSLRQSRSRFEMGASGYKILDDDSVVDVYDDYLSKFDEGIDPKVIRSELEESFADFHSDPKDGFLFWFGLARAQWECGFLDADVFEKVEKAVADGRDLKRWDEYGAEKRRAILDRFVAQLRVPKSKPRRPPGKPKRKRRCIPPIYQAGDCLALRLEDGRYAAAVVIAAVGSEEEDGGNLIVLIRYLGSGPPTLEDFQRREYLRLTHHECGGRLAFQWCGARGHKKVAANVSCVGHVELTNKDPVRPHVGVGFTDSWDTGRHMVWQDRWDQGIHDFPS